MRRGVVGLGRDDWVDGGRRERKVEIVVATRLDFLRLVLRACEGLFGMSLGFSSRVRRAMLPVWVKVCRLYCSRMSGS